MLIATPQHLHALNFVPAIQAGKDVYQEKTMAFNPDHAKRMRKALEGSGRVVQVGIQSTSSPAVAQVREYLQPERIGLITQLHTFHYRNAPYGGWKRPVPADCDLQHVDWKAFEGEAKEHPFDPNRLINWRFFWDYSGGNVYENMVHQVGFWFKLLDLKIPQKVTMVGANYLSPDMQVPDTMDVSMIQREKILFTWNSMFGNNLMGAGYDEVLGQQRNDSARRELQRALRSPGEEGGGPQPGRSARQGSRHRRHERYQRSAHAEFLRLRAQPQRNQLPPRIGIPLRRRLPHGRGVLPARPHRRLGRGEGRDCVVSCGRTFPCGRRIR